MTWFERIDKVPANDYDAELKRSFKCVCGHTYTFYCQNDNAPEYYTYITMVCPICDTLTKMEFPVN